MPQFVYDPVTGEYEHNHCVNCYKDMSNSAASLCLECETVMQLKEILEAFHCQECGNLIKVPGLCPPCQEEFDIHCIERHEYPEKDWNS